MGFHVPAELSYYVVKVLVLMPTSPFSLNSLRRGLSFGLAVNTNEMYLIAFDTPR